MTAPSAYGEFANVKPLNFLLQAVNRFAKVNALGSMVHGGSFFHFGGSLAVLRVIPCSPWPNAFHSSSARRKPTSLLTRSIANIFGLRSLRLFEAARPRPLARRNSRDGRSGPYQIHLPRPARERLPSAEQAHCFTSKNNSPLRRPLTCGAGTPFWALARPNNSKFKIRNSKCPELRVRSHPSTFEF